MEHSLVYNLENLHLIESTYDDEDSFYIFNEYQNIYNTYVKYSYPDIDYGIVSTVFNDFCLFYGKIKESENAQLHSSIFPLGVIRCMIHEDLSYSNYYTPRRKPGWVLEGYFWTNGLIYRLREDKKEKFQTYELSCFLGTATATLMGLVDPEKYIGR